MILSMIVAYTKDSEGRQIIGKGGKIPWSIPEDLAWFRECTEGHAVVMGRKTYESIGRPLPGRDNIIVSTDPGLVIPGACTATSLKDALEFAAQRHHEVFIIGGQTLYEQCLDKVDRIYVTYIKENPGYEGDTFFPKWKRPDFRSIQREVTKDEYNGTVTHKVYQRFKYTYARPAPVENPMYGFLWSGM
jgi:dihydrofolate reductase